MTDDEIEAFAFRDLEHWMGDRNGVPADNLFFFIRELGISLREATLAENILGQLDLGGSVIIERNMRSKCRPRTDIRGVKHWTIAHEIGHWRLHRWTIQNGTLTDRHEYQADSYARGLLLPVADVELQAETHELKEGLSPNPRASVVALANRYKVSPGAIEVRLQRMGVLDEGVPARPPAREFRQRPVTWLRSVST